MREWVIPVVVLIVWLVSTIVKGREADEPVRPRPGGGGGNGGRKPTSDIDRFLQEIDRLRRRPGEEGQRPVVRPKPAPPPVPRVRPVPKPVRLEAVEVAVVPVVRPVGPPTPAEFVAPPPVVRAVRDAQVTGTEVPQAPGVVAALHLLRSPRTIAAAVVLNEVLGPPKCKRS